MKRILVVEDDPRVATALTVRLRTAGYDVLAAPGPCAGASFAQAAPPDLVITDLRLPHMDGFAFVRQLRRTGLAAIPVIVLTACRGDGLWETAMQLGASAYFEKPYDPDQLLATVASVLSPADLTPQMKGTTP
jgi:DNA-binding response OmpR family regulator